MQNIAKWLIAGSLVLSFVVHAIVWQEVMYMKGTVDSDAMRMRMLFGDNKLPQRGILEDVSDIQKRLDVVEHAPALVDTEVLTLPEPKPVDVPMKWLATPKAITLAALIGEKALAQILDDWSKKTLYPRDSSIASVVDGASVFELGSTTTEIHDVTGLERGMYSLYSAHLIGSVECEKGKRVPIPDDLYILKNTSTGHLALIDETRTWFLQDNCDYKVSEESEPISIMDALNPPGFLDPAFVLHINDDQPIHLLGFGIGSNEIVQGFDDAESWRGSYVISGNLDDAQSTATPAKPSLKEIGHTDSNVFLFDEKAKSYVVKSKSGLIERVAPTPMFFRRVFDRLPNDLKKLFVPDKHGSLPDMGSTVVNASEFSQMKFEGVDSSDDIYIDPSMRFAWKDARGNYVIVEDQSHFDGKGF